MKSTITLVLAAMFAMLSPTCAHSQDTSRRDLRQDSSFDGKAFLKVEIESEFPGGSRAWLQFLNDHLVYPRKAVRKRIQGTVVLQFIVDKQGNVTDLQAISGDPLLAEAALKVMAQSPRWTPAIQKGRPVKSYKKQPIVFRLEYAP